MKQINLSWMGLLTALCITSGIFVGCQKDVKQETNTKLGDFLSAAAAKPGGSAGPTAFLMQVSATPIVGDAVNVGEEFNIAASLTKKDGSGVNPNNNSSLTLTVTSPDGIIATPVLFDGVTSLQTTWLAEQAGWYAIKVCAVHAPSENALPVNPCATIYVFVFPADEGGGECIEPGITLEAELFVIEFDENLTPNGKFKAVYTVNTCKAFDQLKLQGGLTAGATPTASYISPDDIYPYTDGRDEVNTLQAYKKTNQNTIITWQLKDVPENYSKQYITEFTKQVKPGENYLTGNWSIKDKNGNALGGVQPDGYTQRLTFSY